MAGLAEAELSENALWDEPSPSEDEEQEHQHGPSSSDGEADAAPGGGRASFGVQHDDSKRRGRAIDIAGGSSASHQSSTLRASLDEELGASVPTPSPPVDVPGGFGSRRAALPQLRSTHPCARLGTSAPIAIPAMARWGRGGLDGAGSGGRPGEAASTFIPPHQLSRQEDFTFSFTGASPSATLKRERLRARNAILRSTGFLEPQAGQASPAAPLLEPSAGLTAAVSRTPVQSSLTAALTTIGES